MKKTIKFFIALICILFSFSNNFAEIIQDTDFNYSLDIPEGFSLEDYSDDGKSYLFTHTNLPVSFAIKIYENVNQAAPEVLKTALTKLSVSSYIDSFTWNDSLCGISNFSLNLDKKYNGWAIAAPLSAENSFIVMICYAPEEKIDQCQQFIISILNSLCIDEKFYCTPGIIVSYAYPKEGTKEISLNINSTTIKTSLDKSDVEAADFFVSMEYGVLCFYANHDLWKEAWQRYYRLIYRDNFGRMENCISDVLDVLYPLAKKKNPQQPELFVAQTLLSWVQNFEYKRAKTANESDFTSLPAMISGVGNDCDSRSLLLCTFMRALGIDSILLISSEYSHAMAAVDIDAPGQKYVLEQNNREFLMGETTAKVTWGTIAQDHSDRTKFIPVYLP